MKIGLALSGGGFRATVFHLGVLARLAKEKRLEDVSIISTVSGGSLCIGLIYALNQFRWPGSAEYLDRIIKKAHDVLITQNLESALIWRGLRSPWKIFETRADDLSALLCARWGVTARLCDLPEHPRWMINATCYETGKNWRFECFRMGDYLFGYTDQPNIPLSDALAASAGFPILIGPLIMRSRKYSWYRYKDPETDANALMDPKMHKHRQRETIVPDFPSIHLWDGGVYDNHALEGLHDFLKGWQDDIEFFIVSDGAGRSKPENYRRGYKALFRMVTGIMMEQVRSLRSRAILERLINHGDMGAFLQMGNTRTEILQRAGVPDKAEALAGSRLNEEDIKLAAEFPTTIKRLTEDEFDRLFRHGFEVANDTFYAYHEQDFKDIPYHPVWGVKAIDERLSQSWK